jgi:hypothetical protein
MLNLFCTFTLALSEACVVSSVAVFCSSLISRFYILLLRYFLNYFEMDTVAAIFIGIAFFFNFHIRCKYIYIYIYIYIFILQDLCIIEPPLLLS